MLSEIVLTVLFCGAISWIVISVQQKEIRWKIQRLEERLDAIQKHVGLKVDDPVLEEIRPFLEKGDDIGALRTYRKVTGATLAGAKEYLEAVKRK